MVKIKYIPNEDLELDKIPNPDNESFDFEGHPFESQLGWQRFALTIDGYNVAGGLEACSKCVSQVLSEKEKATLTQMRCALFSFNDMCDGHMMTHVLNQKPKKLPD